MRTGIRKITAFLITAAVYSVVILTAVMLLRDYPEILPSFAVQLATAYGILCGLFFGSNVLEHFSKKGERRDE